MEALLAGRSGWPDGMIDVARKRLEVAIDVLWMSDKEIAELSAEYQASSTIGSSADPQPRTSSSDFFASAGIAGRNCRSHGDDPGVHRVLVRESDEAFRAVVAACGRDDGATMPRTSGARRVVRPIPYARGPLIRAPAGWRRDGSPARARMTVIMTVFVTVIRPAPFRVL